MPARFQDNGAKQVNFDEKNPRPSFPPGKKSSECQSVQLQTFSGIGILIGQWAEESYSVATLYHSNMESKVKEASVIDFINEIKRRPNIWNYQLLQNEAKENGWCGKTF